jgi:hypothetical protein
LGAGQLVRVIHHLIIGLGGLDLRELPHGGPEIRDFLDRPIIKGGIFREILLVFLVDKIHESVHVAVLDPFLRRLPQHKHEPFQEAAGLTCFIPIQNFLLQETCLPVHPLFLSELLCVLVGSSDPLRPVVPPFKVERYSLLGRHIPVDIIHQVSVNANFLKCSHHVASSHFQALPIVLFLPI